MKRLLVVFWLLGAFSVSGYADAPNPVSPAEKEQIRTIVKEVLREYAANLGDKQVDPTAKDVMKTIVQDNAKFVRTHKAVYFSPFADSQHPRATVITCSDSRVHMHALDDTPDNDLFVIRDIGNQISTAEGSVEYGVHHLHTPLLLIVGHSGCGAIKAASGDYAGEPPSIQRELDTIQIPKGDPGMNSIRLNVNNQIRYAMNKFEEEVLAGKLTVVGAIYDFRNDLGNGQGKLTVINVNGETDSVKIAALNLMQGTNESEASDRAGKKAHRH
jgi:carbonic anhydrase